MMNFQRIKVIVGKEWNQTFSQRSALGIILGPAFATTVLLAVLIPISRLPDAASNLGTVLDYFLMFFVCMPSVYSAKNASAGITADKSSRCLEPLLATPLSPSEFIVGKLTVAVLPHVLATWVAYFGFVAFSQRMGATESHLFGNTTGLLCISVVFSVSLLLSLFGSLISFGISARATDGRSASRWAMGAAETMMLTPILGVYACVKYKLTGGVWLASATSGLLLANLIVLLVVITLFQRESVLFKWK
jgi:ABC-2 type transport system permease protein